MGGHFSKALNCAVPPCSSAPVKTVGACALPEHTLARAHSLRHARGARASLALCGGAQARSSGSD